MKGISKKTERKKELDRLRNEWRKKHRILNGKIILWPDKPPEHINARASKTYNWFWKNILLLLHQHDIPAIIANIKDQIGKEDDPKKIRKYRTMIGMAEDAYQLKNLEGIMEFDTELMFEKKPIYNSETGIIYKDGNMYTVDYKEDETEILVRDNEGTIMDRLHSGNGKEETIKDKRIEAYKNWDYMEGN